MRVTAKNYSAPWHFLYFLPLPHGHGSLRPVFFVATAVRPPDDSTGWFVRKFRGGAFTPVAAATARCARSPSSVGIAVVIGAPFVPLPSTDGCEATVIGGATGSGGRAAISTW